MPAGPNASPRSPSAPTRHRPALAALARDDAGGCRSAQRPRWCADRGPCRTKARALAERQARTVTAPIAVGLYAWRDGNMRASAGCSCWRSLVPPGAAGSTTSSSTASDAWPAGTVEAAMVYLILAFPSGRLRQLGSIACLRSPSWLSSRSCSYPRPDRESLSLASQISSCTDHCPRERVFAARLGAGGSRRAHNPLRELLAALLLIAVVVRLADRIRRATRLMRRTLSRCWSRRSCVRCRSSPRSGSAREAAGRSGAQYASPGGRARPPADLPRLLHRPRSLAT